MRRSIAIALMLGLVGTAHASAQSLADVARKERERREAVTAGKVYTNEHLVPDPHAPPAETALETDTVASTASEADADVPAAAADDAGGDVAAEGAAAAAPADASWIRGGDEDYWRRRATAIRLRVTRAQENLDKVSGTSQRDPKLRARMDELRAKAEASLARAREDLDRFLQDAAAREVPASWIEP